MDRNLTALKPARLETFWEIVRIPRPHRTHEEKI